MFLTRFQINPARRGARKLLSSPQAMHAAVRAAFPKPDDYERPGSRTLWRIDKPATATVHLYLVSPGRPDLTHLVEQAGWPTTSAWDTREYDPLLATLQPGQRWAFRLTANPTHSGRKTADAKETQRFGHLRENEQQDWLLQRAARNGFTVATQRDGRPNLRLHQRQTLSFKRGAYPVTLTTATFDGILEITDKDQFRAALSSGIGHAKAYGCGLLTLAKAQETTTGQ
ncbi:type I-E CRISPR-associated protein Cas6/Cse3/CasE [Actinoplanes sp. LDG1-06]|uniref:Type I-E CRISPR-associated protein Cas6/Cse3/CasE n=1 Tax=Paractinoplanes ovalisporus TaxID=2810368 RepID=A0ABS2ASV6_9ACTN|nr:type I-E CRISPR-associated protein Cas6/Cse3/CasE [Actinoplanes ovalisporus]MBM2622927.1 type I-E CRISPR-associated protein Cas6/Cse3/CasE [Actinoplanes ovalisporus]